MSGLILNTDALDLALARLGGESVDDGKLLHRLAVDRENPLLDRIADLMVTLAHAGIDDGLRIKARLDGAADLIAAGAVDAQAVFPDHLEDARVEIGFDGIMDDIMVALRDRDGTLQRLAQEIDVIQVKRSAVVSQLFRDFAAKHIKFVFD